MDRLEPSRARLGGIIEHLERGLVERGCAVRLTLLGALAGEHTLLVGPPGTAKSELARRVHRAFRDARYFERLLTRFTVPEELFGPLSIRALEEDRYERHTAGFLPEASIAFIDEVFKANSAILNALLTLLNEREFDNGAGRIRCPLISVIGATNEIPEDEVAEAFFDRFLLRVNVAPVSDDGFGELIELRGDCGVGECADALEEADLRRLTATALKVGMPAAVVALLAELRVWLAASGAWVSDRRWVKIAGLLRMACASEGRSVVSVWDLWLLPWCVAADRPAQQAAADWLTDRLGVGTVPSTPRLTRVVEAFEAQLEAECNANHLDYDESGRLRFSPDLLAGEVADTKGGASAPRMTYARKRRYGVRHIEARTTQLDDLTRRIEGYAQELADCRADFASWRAGSLWLDADAALRIEAALAGTATGIDGLLERVRITRAGFEALPRLDGEMGKVPEPVPHEPLSF
ncbi:MAG: AAA family ATPase [Rhodocyclaceae bacterium]|nr:AAA family ATPase [Rhodocyclaceae bacterium]